MKNDHRIVCPFVDAPKYQNPWVLFLIQNIAKEPPFPPPPKFLLLKPLVLILCILPEWSQGMRGLHSSLEALGPVHIQAHSGCWLNPPPCLPNTEAPGSLLLIGQDQSITGSCPHFFSCFTCDCPPNVVFGLCTHSHKWLLCCLHYLNYFLSFSFIK